MLDPVVGGLLEANLALIFLASGVQKARDPAWFARAVREYDLIPQWASTPFAAAVTLVELICAIGVLWAPTRVLAASGMVALLLVFSVAVTINLVRGRRDVDCGCFGPAGTSNAGLSGWIVLRNLALAAMAAALWVPTGVRPVVWVDYVTLGFATVTSLLVFAVVNRLIAAAPGLAKLRRGA
ncbi:MAG: methylamine utilization protein MauE [Betaproteobacteria bacterium]|nr:methylamine utilization protein MauE [Betaproteobacteria bacterium]MDE2209270.1 methylamine utilization protein MauE [Betaproteobacteria bacterium]MDE2357978.1 methylamine utilization protein MauE [Betaproteobacteria bacterium]